MELCIMWGIIFSRILPHKNNSLKYYTCSHVCRYANDPFTCWKILCYKYTTKSIYHLILIEDFPFDGYYNYCYHKHSRINTWFHFSCFYTREWLVDSKLFIVSYMENQIHHYSGHEYFYFIAWHSDHFKS